MTREYAVAAIKNMPQEFELEELIDKLMFMEQVSKGLNHIADRRKIALEQILEQSKVRHRN